MSTLTPRVNKLENVAAEHLKRLDRVDDKFQDYDIVIYGRENCPGLVPRMAEVEKAIIEMKIYSRIVMFIGGAFGLSVVALIWGILTHTVTLIH